jgi:PIN domain nuclease of toxin-antitoxin system
LKYLLDTCAFLWLAQGNFKLSPGARFVIDNPDNEGALSTASIWELSMKAVLGKLSLPMPPSALEHLALQEGLSTLPLIVAHVDLFHRLPTEHRDPFDRVIAAVALVGGYIMLSPDTAFDALRVDRIW